MPAVTTTVEALVELDPAAAFRGLVGMDLPAVMTGYGPLPAVIATRDLVGTWSAPGDTRLIELSDGSTASERLEEWRPPESIRYTVSDFSGVLRLLTVSASGAWQFEAAGDDTTRVTWRFAYRSRSYLGLPLLWLIVRLYWKSYMRQTLAAAQRRVEAAAAGQQASSATGCEP